MTVYFFAARLCCELTARQNGGTIVKPAGQAVSQPGTQSAGLRREGM